MKLDFRIDWGYHYLYSRKHYHPKALREIVLNSMIHHTWEESNREGFTKQLEEIIFVTIASNTNVYGKMGKIIDLAKELLEDNQANYSGLNALSNKIPVYRALAGKSFNNINSFITLLNDEINKQDTSVPERTQGGSTGGGNKSNKVAVQPNTEVMPEPIKVIQKIDRYRDLDGAGWAIDAISYFMEKEILVGRSETEFCPNDSMTREELAKLLVLSFGLDTRVRNEVKLEDVDSEGWYYNYVACANIIQFNHWSRVASPNIISHRL